MQRLKKSVEIDVPVNEVYGFLTNPTNLPSVWPSLVEVANVERRADGWHSFNWVYKMAGLPFRGSSRTQRVEQDRLVEDKVEGGIPSTFRWIYAPTPSNGARLTVEVEYTIPTPVFGKIAEAVAVKLNERELDTLLANTKTLLESQKPEKM